MKLLGAPTIAEWEDTAGRCGWATFFHSPTWSRILTDTFPYLKDASFSVEMSNGTKVIMPLYLRRRGPLGILNEKISTFPGTYGGPITSSVLRRGEFGEICRFISVGLRCFRVAVLGTPFFDYGEPPPGYRSEPTATHMLDLSAGFDAIVDGYSNTHRRGLKKAEESGLTTRVADGREDYEEYYRIYRETLSRWERPTSRYPLALFLNIHRLGEGHVRLWLVEKDGRPIAGALIFYWNFHVVYWHGASLTDYLPLSPNVFLHTEIIKRCCREGHRYYDFNPSGGHAGVEQFKVSFGCTAKPITHWILEPNPVFRLYRKIF